VATISPSSFRDAPQGAGPESITTAGEYGFRVRRFAAPLNNDGERTVPRNDGNETPRNDNFDRATDWADRIVAARKRRPFTSLEDFARDTGLPKRALILLADADAFRSLGLDRRAARWAVRALRRAGDKDDLPLFAHVSMPQLEPDVSLPPMRLGEQVIEDYRHLRLSLKAHPVSFLRGDLGARGVLAHERLTTIPSGRRVTVAGLVLVRQRPGTSGVIFMTLEDETGIANVIVWPRVFETYRPLVLGSRLVAVTGEVQSASDVVHVVAEHVEDFSSLLRRISQDAAPPPTRRKDGELAADPPRHPRAGDSLVRLLAAERRERTDEHELAAARAVLPKGRNFH
jgi:error-prone DNA polymerase